MDNTTIQQLYKYRKELEEKVKLLQELKDFTSSDVYKKLIKPSLQTEELLKSLVSSSRDSQSENSVVDKLKCISFAQQLFEFPLSKYEEVRNLLVEVQEQINEYQGEE